MEIKASAKYVRIGTQKAREVADLIRGRNVNDALNILAYNQRKISGLLEKVLKSAVANAEQKKVIDVDGLYVKTIFINQGPHFKRFRPAARGSAAPLKKKQSHIQLVLSERKKR